MLTQLPIRPTKHPRPNRDEAKNAREHRINPNRKQEERGQREAPDQEVQSDSGVHLLANEALARDAVGRVCGREAEVRELQEPEREPEDAEQAADHHGEELRLDPEEDCREEEEHGAGEEEYAAGAGLDLAVG